MGPAQPHCIMKDQLLNGVENCPLGDDENPAEFNECELKIAKCSEKAICINVEDGAYVCLCPENFTGDGVDNCIRIDSNIDKETTAKIDSSTSIDKETTVQIDSSTSTDKETTAKIDSSTSTDKETTKDANVESTSNNVMLEIN